MAKNKNSVAAKRQYDRGSLYGVEDAIALVRSMAFAKFDESVDLVFSLGIDARKADQLVRGTVSLPHGTGKEIRVIDYKTGAKSDKYKEQMKRYIDALKKFYPDKNIDGYLYYITEKNIEAEKIK